MCLDPMASPRSLRTSPFTTTLSGTTITQSVKLTWGQSSPVLVVWTSLLFFVTWHRFQLLQLERDMQVSKRMEAISRGMIRGNSTELLSCAVDFFWWFFLYVGSRMNVSLLLVNEGHVRWTHICTALLELCHRGQRVWHLHRWPDGSEELLWHELHQPKLHLLPVEGHLRERGGLRYAGHHLQQ